MENNTLLREFIQTTIRQYLNEVKVDEIFGFSKHEKEIQFLKQKIQKAKDELLKYNFAGTCATPLSDYEVSRVSLTNIMSVRLNLCRNDFPTLVELLPQYFKTQTATSIIYRINGNELDAYVPSELYRFVSNNGILDNEVATERLMSKLDEILDKAKR